MILAVLYTLFLEQKIKFQDFSLASIITQAICGVLLFMIAVNIFIHGAVAAERARSRMGHSLRSLQEENDAVDHVLSPVETSFARNSSSQELGDDNDSSSTEQEGSRGEFVRTVSIVAMLCATTMVVTAIPSVLSAVSGAFIMYSIVSRGLEISLAAVVLRLLIYPIRRNVCTTNIAQLSSGPSIHNISALTYSGDDLSKKERTSPLELSPPICSPITTTSLHAVYSNTNAAFQLPSGTIGNGIIQSDINNNASSLSLGVNYWRKPFAWMYSSGNSWKEPTSGYLIWSRSGTSQDSRDEVNVAPPIVHRRCKNTAANRGVTAQKFSMLSRNSSSDDSTDSGNNYFV